MFEERQNHESYGMIGISRSSCAGSVAMFGSPIKHDKWITLQIKRADIKRDLNHDWYFGKENLITIALSESQFAQLITTMNVGDGVPCTIKAIETKVMKKPPYRGQNEIFSEELQEDFKKAMVDADALKSDAEEILLRKGRLKVTDRKELIRKISSLVGHIKGNIPFLHKQFNRSMNKTVSIAKAEIEGFYNSTITKLGTRALENGEVPEIPVIEPKNK